MCYAFIFDEQRAEQVITNISKHFGLDSPVETIKNYAKDVLLSYTIVYKNKDGGEFFSELDRKK